MQSRTGKAIRRPGDKAAGNDTPNHHVKNCGPARVGPQCASYPKFITSCGRERICIGASARTIPDGRVTLLLGGVGRAAGVSFDTRLRMRLALPGDRKSVV